MKRNIPFLTMVFASALSFGAADDAAKMGAEKMNPGSAMRTVERIGGGEFKVLVYGNSIALHGPLAAPLRLTVKDASGEPLELVPYGCAKLRVAMFPNDAGKCCREGCN